MASAPTTVSADAALPTVARTLRQRRLQRVYVEDVGRLVGMVSIHELLEGVLGTADGTSYVAEAMVPTVIGCPKAEA